MKYFSLALLVCVLGGLMSCSKVEGDGGAATLKGSVLGKKYNAVGNVIAEYPLAKKDVFIIYGTSTTYFDDKIETSYDGTFEFRNLQPGNYTIFVYSKSLTDPSGDVTVLKEVTISKAEKKQAIDVGVIEVRD